MFSSWKLIALVAFVALPIYVSAAPLVPPSPALRRRDDTNLLQIFGDPPPSALKQLLEGQKDKQPAKRHVPSPQMGDGVKSFHDLLEGVVPTLLKPTDGGEDAPAEEVQQEKPGISTLIQVGGSYHLIHVPSDIEVKDDEEVDENAILQEGLVGARALMQKKLQAKRKQAETPLKATPKKKAVALDQAKATMAEAAEAEEANVVEAKAQQFVRAILHQSGSVAANSPKDEAHDDINPEAKGTMPLFSWLFA